MAQSQMIDALFEASEHTRSSRPGTAREPQYPPHLQSSQMARALQQEPYVTNHSFCCIKGALGLDTVSLARTG